MLSALSTKSSLRQISYGMLVSVCLAAISPVAMAQDLGQQKMQFSLPVNSQNNMTVRQKPENMENPWMYEEPKQEPATGAALPGTGQTPASQTTTSVPVPAAAGTSQAPAKPKHWTEMNYAELKTEIEREDTPYTPYTKKEMRARLKVLEANANGTAAPAASTAPTGQQPSAPPAANAPAPVVTNQGEPVRIVPADTTPWWKKPKGERAAAKAAQQNKGNTASQKPDSELTPRERIYRDIEKNRGR